MAYRTYDDRYHQDAHDDYWDRRWRRVMRSREGFAWGAFALGFFVGAIIF